MQWMPGVPARRQRRTSHEEEMESPRVPKRRNAVRYSQDEAQQLFANLQNFVPEAGDSVGGYDRQRISEEGGSSGTDDPSEDDEDVMDNRNSENLENQIIRFHRERQGRISSQQNQGGLTRLDQGFHREDQGGVTRLRTNSNGTRSQNQAQGNSGNGNEGNSGNGRTFDKMYYTGQPINEAGGQVDNGSNLRRDQRAYSTGQNSSHSTDAESVNPSQQGFYSSSCQGSMQGSMISESENEQTNQDQEGHLPPSVSTQTADTANENIVDTSCAATGVDNDVSTSLNTCMSSSTEISVGDIATVGNMGARNVALNTAFSSCTQATMSTQASASDNINSTLSNVVTQNENPPSNESSVKEDDSSEKQVEREDFFQQKKSGSVKANSTPV